MAEPVDRDERKRLRNAYKAGERAEARTHMLLDAEALDSLLDHVDAAVEANGCDHSLRATRQWAAANNVDPDALATSLVHFGGHCDCEVAANVEPEEIFG